MRTINMTKYYLYGYKDPNNEASRKYNCSKGVISDCINKRRKSAYGYKWEAMNKCAA